MLTGLRLLFDNLIFTKLKEFDVLSVCQSLGQSILVILYLYFGSYFSQKIYMLSKKCFIYNIIYHFPYRVFFASLIFNIFFLSIFSIKALKRRMTRGGINKEYLMEHLSEYPEDIFGPMVK